MPAFHKFTLGFAVIADSFNKDFEDNSILRYAESNNRIENIDFVPGIGIKFNDFFSLGAGMNFSRVNGI